MYNKRQRTAALISCAAIMFVMLFSVLFIIGEVDHDCIGQDCPICAYIHEAEQILNQLGNGAVSVAAVIIVPMLLLCLCIAVLIEAISNNTLVNQKVRLND